MKKILSALIIGAALFVGGCGHQSAINGNVYLSVLPQDEADEIGHGSAIYLGEGKFLTAAHVVKDAPRLEVQSLDGPSLEVKTLWINTEYDIALVTATKDFSEVFETSPISCRKPIHGETIETTGNPIDLRFITTWGRVTSYKSISVPDMWKEVYVSDIKIAPGSSGGGVLDDQGNIIGVIVGVQQFGDDLFASFFVPSSAVCDLLARSS